MNAEPISQSVPRRRTGPLWAMALIFGLPFLAAVLFYLNPDWLPQTQGNRGSLIDPPVATAHWQLLGADGQPATLAEAVDSWVIVLIAGPGCDPRCQERLHELQQVRRAAGVERARVERLLLFSVPPAQDAVTQLRQQDPRLMLRTVSGREPLIGTPLEPGAVVLVDPMGNAMMRYAAGAAARDLLKDLKHLLKVSKEWGASAQ